MDSSCQNDRLPAEWEPQDAVLFAWPHKETDWAPTLSDVEAVYLDIIQKVTPFEHVIIVHPTPAQLDLLLTDSGIDRSRVLLFQADTNDTWTRDYGPITTLSGNTPRFLDFSFNGWGDKFEANKDDKVTRQLCRSGLIQPGLHQPVTMVLEGGSIESDGCGTLMTTTRCLLNPNRNPGLSRQQIEQRFGELFGVNRTLWLDHGWLAGDDTDAHIDTLARFAPHETILYVSCDDPEDQHYNELRQMEAQLQRFTGRTGEPYRLLPLPWPAACYDGDERLPATYANYLVINGAVLVPVYNDPADSQALETIAQAFTDRQVIPVDCHPLIRQHGSLHCITMQLPAGALR